MKILKLIIEFFLKIKDCGVKYTLWKLKQIILLLFLDYKRIFNKLFFEFEEKYLQKQLYDNDICFHIFLIINNCDILFLEKQINSLNKQFYKNWSLTIISQNKLNLKNYKKVKFINHNFNDGQFWQNCNIKQGYVILLGEDVLLKKAALLELYKCINKFTPNFIYTDEEKENTKYFYKPEYSPNLLRSFPYMGNFICFKSEYINYLKENDIGLNNFWGVSLFICDKFDGIYHISKVLFKSKSSFDKIFYERNTLEKFLKYKKLNFELAFDDVNKRYNIKYLFEGNPLVSIVIPNKDNIALLKKCLESIFASDYSNYEVIIIENNSKLDETFEYYKFLKKNSKIRVVTYSGGFNYSKINNFAVKRSNGEYIIMLNNDVEIISQDWIGRLLGLAQQSMIGAVGVKLYYADKSIQHAGVVLGLYGVAGHIFKDMYENEKSYMNFVNTERNVSAVTGACIMVSKEKFNEVNGLDEGFAVDYNDVDFCLKLNERGYYNVYTPYVKAFHYESKSRSKEIKKNKYKRLYKESVKFKKKWKCVLSKGDSFYNINLKLRNPK